MGRKKYPKTQEEAFEMIDAMLSDEDKREALKIKDEEEFACEQHWGLGVWVRNNWIYGGKVDYDVLDGATIDLDPDKPFPDALIIRSTPDDLSNKFVALYHKHLRETYKD